MQYLEIDVKFSFILITVSGSIAIVLIGVLPAFIENRFVRSSEFELMNRK